VSGIWEGIFLAVGCGLAFSALDLVRKLLADRVKPAALLFFMAAGSLAPFLIWCMASGAAGPQAGYWLPGLLSVGLNVLANLAYFEAVRRSPLSLTIPILALTPVFTAFLAIPLLGERLSLRQFGGVGLVVAGVLLLNLSARVGNSNERLPRRLAGEAGSRLMILVALLWSLAMPLDKLAMREASVPFHGFALNGGVALAMLLLLLRQGRLAELRLQRREGLLVLFAIVVTVLALALQLLAVARIWVAVVETLKRAIGSVMALVLGAALLSEGMGRRRILAVLLLAAGVALILL
jgi:drug/metabolite transporter (DMT)-like permease